MMQGEVKMNEHHCYNCAFKECGDGGYGSCCNLEQDAFHTKPCYTNREPRNKPITWSCKYFMSKDDAITMINKERGYNV